ncbi:MAG: hypothetical protein JST60_05955 [Chloroflexi bacterium SZAS-1]|nr:hypothetical protein [Chloroflexi bacterium SZAS-1]
MSPVTSVHQDDYQVTNTDVLLSALLQKYENEKTARATNLLAEYNNLREEILQNNTLSMQITAAIIAICGALMGYALSQGLKEVERSYLFIAIQSIGFIGLWQNLNRYQAVYIAASYLEVFIEPELPGIRWETRLAKFRSWNNNFKRTSFISSNRTTYIVIILSNLALNWLYYPKGYDNVYFFIWLIIVVIAIAISWLQYDKFAKNHTSFFKKTWRKIKEGE